MDRRRLLQAFFPVGVLCLLAAERVATIMLGSFPSAPFLWEVWLELRSLFRPISYQLDRVSGSIALQVWALAIAALVVFLAACGTRRSAWSFLTNHLMLIFTVATMVIAGNRTIAGFGFAGGGTDMTLLVVSPDLSGLKMAVLAAGVAACAYCHYVFIRDARRKHAALKLRVIELQRWL